MRYTLCLVDEVLSTKIGICKGNYKDIDNHITMQYEDKKMLYNAIINNQIFSINNKIEAFGFGVKERLIGLKEFRDSIESNLDYKFVIEYMYNGDAKYMPVLYNKDKRFKDDVRRIFMNSSMYYTDEYVINYLEDLKNKLKDQPQTEKIRTLASKIKQCYRTQDSGSGFEYDNLIQGFYLSWFDYRDDQNSVYKELRRIYCDYNKIYVKDYWPEEFKYVLFSISSERKKTFADKNDVEMIDDGEQITFFDEINKNHRRK